MDDITKNYQSLGDASAGAADGFDGLLRQFNQLGNYSLPAFTKAVKANTAGLAALGGNAAMGAEELSKVSGALTTKDTARQFLKLGISLDAVGDATAGYLADYAKSGTLQGLTTDQLTKKTQDYILEVDKIARLTGQTRAQQEDERRKSMANAQFRAQLAQMNASGQQDNAAALKTFANAIGGPAADAIRAYSTGIPLTTQAAEANLFTNDKLREITLKVRDGQLSAAQATVELQDALGQGVNTFGTLTAYGKDLGGVFVQAADQQAIVNSQNKTAAERLADAEATQKKMIDSESELTEKFVDANLATAGAAKNIQSLGFSLASLAVGPVKKFADGLEYATGVLNRRFGIGGTTSTPAGVDRGAAGGPRGAMGGVVPGRSVTIGDQTRTGGDRNWRNNNPGNIEYGPFAIKYGAIGSDGRFAIFPSEEQGRMAQDALLKSKNYASLSLSDAIKRYAPSNENDPKSYARQIMAQTGIDQNMRYADLTPEQQSRVLDAMKRIEGGRAGTVSGPTGSRTNTMSDVNYNGAGVATQAQGQKVQAEQSAKTEITGLAQIMERIEYNTRNGARAQEKTNRLVS
jgi:ribosomal protein S13